MLFRWGMGHDFGTLRPAWPARRCGIQVDGFGLHWRPTRIGRLRGTGESAGWVNLLAYAGDLLLLVKSEDELRR